MRVAAATPSGLGSVFSTLGFADPAPDDFALALALYARALLVNAKSDVRLIPTPGMTLAGNRGDLERHAADFAGRSGFTYTVRATGSDEIIGCVYIYPLADGPGADVRSWVSADRAALDVALYEAVSAWLRSAWPFAAVRYAPR